MRFWRRGVVLGIAISFVMSDVSLAAISEDEQWAVPSNYVPGWHGLVVQDSVDEISGYSTLLALHNMKSPTDWERYVCTSTADKNCSRVEGAESYQFHAILPVCVTEDQLDCVESLSGVSRDTLPGQFTAYSFPTHPNSFLADSAMGIPQGQSPSIWRVPGLPHAYGDEYVVNVSLSGFANPDRVATDLDLAATLTPISRLPGGAKPAPFPRCINWFDPVAKHFRMNCETDPTPAAATYKCMYAAEPFVGTVPSCLLPHAFPSDSRFRVQVRLSREPLAWLHGRMQSPTIQVSKLPTRGVRVSVEAAPTNTPVLYYGDFWEQLPTSLQDFWRKCDASNPRVFRCAGMGLHSLPIEQRGGTMAMPTYGAAALEAVRLLSPLQADRATVTPSAWTFNTLPADQMSSASSCLTRGAGLKGFVTTNSTAYSEGPPEFVDGFLNYRVAAPHFDRNGNIFKGDYSLVIRSDVARCLYKFSSAPVSATVQVVSESGENQIATTVTTEKDGWLYLRASGFTFSAPTVKVALRQKVNSKAVKVTCTRGKLRKVVSGTTCPIGYKRT